MKIMSPSSAPARAGIKFEVIDAALKASANRYKVESEAEKNIEEETT